MKDATKPLTGKDTVDVAVLEAWLRDRVPGLPAGPIVVERFPAGHSNLTYLVRVGGDDGRELVLRAPPPGAAHIATGHDMVREHRILTRLAPVYPLVPTTRGVQEDGEGSPLGTPFYVMDRVDGLILRARAPKHIVLDEATMATLSHRFIDTLADLHRLDLDATGLRDIGRPDGYVQRQVDGWRGRYDKSRTDEVSDLERVSSWLASHVPSRTARPAIVHNDFKYDNLVLDPADPTRIRAVLDWELCTVGEPRMDLGTSLAYWVQADDGDDVRALSLGLTHLPGNATRLELVRRYEERTGVAVDDLVFHYVFALFKVATIAQQIYFRYAKGFTSDERFALMGLGAAVLGAKAARVLDADRIDVP